MAATLTLGTIPASAVTLELVSEEAPQPGITFRHYRTANPATHTWVALVDLCADYVHVDATRAPSGLQTTGAWAQARGVQLATNGDFFRTGPARVYGNALGDGVAWPLSLTGDDPAYSSDWSYKDYGWIAFLWDGVEFTHSKWVKNNADSLGAVGGWRPDEVAPPLPPGALAVVSGFPELVIEGTPITCPSPTDSSCFPDRSDMRERHPRTAMGFTEDRGTFILAVVDGRSAISAGMYGAELTDLMFQLGAWEAFNLDGGGSSTMWVDGSVRNVPSDGSQRAVGNHWGVFAGLDGGKALRPGHCAQRDACGVIPPEGGTIDDDSPCFERYGSPEYWREEASGHGGRLYWTNAWTSSRPDDWAWWQLELAEGGEYLVEYYAEAGFALFDQARYLVQAGGESTILTVDQSAGTGWQPLDSFVFDEGGGQFVALYDNIDATVPADQHIAADALRLTRVGSWCGDETCDADEDCASCADDCAGPVEIPDNGIDDNCNGTTDETSTGPDGGVAEDAGVDSDAGTGLAYDGDVGDDCGCATPGRARSGTAWSWLALLCSSWGWRVVRDRSRRAERRRVLGGGRARLAARSERPGELAARSHRRQVVAATVAAGALGLGCAVLGCAVLGRAVLGCAAGENGGGDGGERASGGAGTGNAGAGTTTGIGGAGATGGVGAGGVGATGGTGATGAGTSSGGTGGTAQVVPVCQIACTSVAQCSSGTLPYDSDNYSCSDGYCHYLGCNSDTECLSLGAYVCRDTGGGVPTCVLACASALQCTVGTPPYDADNYSCPNGFCQYDGCNSDTECASLGNYVCRDIGGGTPYCVAACSEPSHCSASSPPFDADNYDCIDGWCHYTGCNSDSECQYLGAYVCR